MPYNPVREEKTCKACGMLFIALHTSAIYCTVKCKNKGANERRKARDAGVLAQRAAGQIPGQMSQVSGQERANPSLEMLAACEILLLRDSIPWYFTGLVPEGYKPLSRDLEWKFYPEIGKWRLGPPMSGMQETAKLAEAMTGQKPIVTISEIKPLSREHLKEVYKAVEEEDAEPLDFTPGGHKDDNYEAEI